MINPGYYRLRLWICICTILTGLSGSAQVVLQDGDSEFHLETSTNIENSEIARKNTLRADPENQFSSSRNAAWIINGSEDQMYNFWFFYRSCEGSEEFPLPTPTSETISTNQAILTWSGILSENLDLEIVISLTDGGGYNIIESTIKLTNNSILDHCFDIFHYLDLDKSGGNSISFTQLMMLRIIDDMSGFECQFGSFEAGGVEAAEHPGLRDRLNDREKTTLSNGNNVSSDFTGALQWNISVPSGTLRTVTSYLTAGIPIMAPAIPVMGQWGMIILLLLTIIIARIILMQSPLARI